MTAIRGYAPDCRTVLDISAMDTCTRCGESPASLVLTPDGWECYNCGADPDA